jgi:hypothetical protein
MRFEESFRDNRRKLAKFSIEQDKTKAKDKIHIMVFEGDNVVPAAIFKL